MSNLNSIPSDYTLWLIKDSIEVDSNYKVVVDTENNLIFCNGCPCTPSTWYFLYRSACTNVRNDQYETDVKWDEPVLEAIVCLNFTPPKVNTWYWVRKHRAYYYTTLNERCVNNTSYPDESIPNIPVPSKPDLATCCDYMNITEHEKTELPYDLVEVEDLDEEGNVIGTHTIKKYKDIYDDSNPDGIKIGSVSISRTTWAKWTLNINEVKGTLKLKIRSAKKGSDGSYATRTEELGTYNGEMVNLTYQLSPGWYIELYLTTNFAESCNTVETPENSKNPDAYYVLSGVTESTVCDVYYFIKFKSSCQTTEVGCKYIGSPELDSESVIEHDYIIMAPYSKVWPYYDSDKRYPMYYSSWQTADETDPNGLYRHVWRGTTEEPGDSSGTYLIRLSTIDDNTDRNNFPSWDGLASLDPNTWEVPKKCEWKKYTNKTEDGTYDKGCPEVPNLYCEYTRKRATILDSFYGYGPGYNAVHRWTDYDPETVGCPGEEVAFIIRGLDSHKCFCQAGYVGNPNSIYWKLDGPLYPYGCDYTETGECIPIQSDETMKFRYSQFAASTNKTITADGTSYDDYNDEPLDSFSSWRILARSPREYRSTIYVVVGDRISLKEFYYGSDDPDAGSKCSDLKCDI